MRPRICLNVFKCFSLLLVYKFTTTPKLTGRLLNVSDMKGINSFGGKNFLCGHTKCVREFALMFLSVLAYVVSSQVHNNPKTDRSPPKRVRYEGYKLIWG